jgi:hypothetical protein
MQAKGVLSKAAMVHLFHSIVSEHGGTDTSIAECISLFAICNVEFAADSHAKAKLTLTDIVDAINKDMEPYGFQIRTARSEVTGKLFYCFVNKVCNILVSSFN